MSYQVLARKWRPQNFQQMVGQAHVLRALINALDENRLHHAYLFTGTRGVGKTTIARIFAKCLNCETGVTATPCGQCRSCLEIAEGRHVDLIEVDAASRTKVEDTRELLDNVQYAPTRGRFKIYLIDEVHMLSGHSFNALLKTLEEPPPHIKFLFATTDPQKLPVTILSRCLQFSLKRMPVDMIGGHLANVLTQENITYSEPALRLLARAADGSMRDALSLTDQAIVAGGGTIQAETVQDMLGLLPHEYLVGLIQSIVEDDGKRMLAIVEQMAQLTTDFTIAADSLIALLHSVAVQQVVANSEVDEATAELARRLTPADVQLYYQMALHGRRDLPLAPDPRSGFEMMLLRMLAFRLADTAAVSTATDAGEKKKTLTPAPNPSAISEPGRSLAPTVSTEPKIVLPSEAKPAPVPLTLAVPANVPAVIEYPVTKRMEEVAFTPSVAVTSAVTDESPPWDEPENLPLKAIQINEKIEKKQSDPILPSNNLWHEIWPQLQLTGMALPLAQHCLLGDINADQVTLLLDESGANLQMAGAEAKLTEALSQYYGQAVKLHFQVIELKEETPEKRAKRETRECQEQAERAIAADPFVQHLQQEFGGVIVAGSIRPRTEAGKL